MAKWRLGLVALIGVFIACSSDESSESDGDAGAGASAEAGEGGEGASGGDGGSGFGGDGAAGEGGAGAGGSDAGTDSGGQDSGGQAGAAGDAGGTVGQAGEGGAPVAAPCPSAAPLQDDECSTVGLCAYEDCDGVGRTVARCVGGYWAIEVAPCGETVNCPGGFAQTCLPGQICLSIASGAYLTECVANTCSESAVSCDCIEGCAGSCNVSATTQGVEIVCNTCPSGMCP